MFKKICLGTAFALLGSYGMTVYATEDTAAPPIDFSLVLSGLYGQLQRPVAAATGFAMNPTPEHVQGFNLGESEMSIAAEIDPQFRATTKLALSPTGGVSVENAFVQTTGRGDGVQLKFGRFFSGLSALNEQHPHAWDFIDQPLAYVVFWNQQLNEDGIQLKWQAPTALMVELGLEMGKGRGFPGTDTAKNGISATQLFAHVGDHSASTQHWRVGTSLHRTQRTDAESTHVPDRLNTRGGVTDRFNGDSQTVGLELLWWVSDDGDIEESSTKVQAEYFQRKESGQLTYDTLGANITDAYATAQRGWYVQALHQFMPDWRSGIRYDRLDSGLTQIGSLNTNTVISDYGFNPSRLSWMVEYSPTTASKFRLQLARDLSRQNSADNQLFLQYIMRIGTHNHH